MQIQRVLAAGVATGAAYYYFASKDAIIMEFYRRSSAEMQPEIEVALKNATGLEQRLRELILVKLAHFAAILRKCTRRNGFPRAEKTCSQRLQKRQTGV
jgi:AcrR family transcriptional regulator